MNQPEKPDSPSSKPLNRGTEKEHEGSLWTHPYVIYIILTLVLFGFILLMGWLALKFDWIPKRTV